MKTRYFLFSLLFCYISHYANAQARDDTDFIIKAQKLETSFLNNTYYQQNKLPFKEIIVFDKRFDTSKIGYLKTSGFGNFGFLKIKLQDSWSKTLNTYFQKNLTPASNNSLVIYIRSYWMQEGLLDELTTKKVITKAEFSKPDFNGHCKAGIDYYIQTGSTLQALFKIEDVFMNYLKYKKNNLEEWFFLPFDSMARKMESTDITTAIDKKRKLSFNEVSEFYNNKQALPVLQSTFSEKGIYMSFEDFKNNKLTVTAFKTKNGKLTDELYLINNGTEELLTDFWGYTENGVLFIKTGFNVFPSVRQQNTFEVFGAKHISNYHNNPAAGGIKLNSMGLDRKILQLNMESGNFY